MEGIKMDNYGQKKPEKIAPGQIWFDNTTKELLFLHWRGDTDGDIGNTTTHRDLVTLGGYLGDMLEQYLSKEHIIYLGTMQDIKRAIVEEIKYEKVPF